MAEEEWLNSWEYWRMYGAVRNRSTTRQLRLFMAACCRLMTQEFYDARLENALRATDQCADNPAAEAVAATIGWETATSLDPAIPQDGWEGELARRIMGIHNLLNEFQEHSADGSYLGFVRHWKQSLAHAVYTSLRDKPGEVFTGGSGDAAEYCALLVNQAHELHEGREFDFHSWPYDWNYAVLEGQDIEVPALISNVLRDIFGNPFRPVAFEPAWSTSTAVALAQQMYDSRDLGIMAILGDALQDAGCDSGDILTHCRDADGTHVRGCWVVDLVLGKS